MTPQDWTNKQKRTIFNSRKTEKTELEYKKSILGSLTRILDKCPDRKPPTPHMNRGKSPYLIEKPPRRVPWPACLLASLHSLSPHATVYPIQINRSAELAPKPINRATKATMTQTRILLADDHALVRAGIRNALAEAPDLDIVGEVGDGPGLLDALSHMPVDALLLDVTMPDFDPIVAIRQIRADYPQLKILVVSAYDDDVYVQGLLGAGVNGYHLKDQSLADLRLAVERVLAGESWISSRLVDKLLQFNSGPRGPQVPAPSPPPARHTERLTLRQREILSYLQEGLDNQAIARRLGLSIKTIENHLTRLYRQLNVQSRLEAVSYANQSPDVVAFNGWEVGKETPRREERRGDPREEVNILLVDDNWRYRRQLCRMVGKAYPDAAIYEADCIQAAVTMAQQVTPRLALVDVVLGDEDGIQCTRRLKAIYPAMRIILISAYPDREFHRRGMEAGVVAFLDKKDLDAETLRQVIQDVAV